jgi:hypothetical protein
MMGTALDGNGWQWRTLREYRECGRKKVQGITGFFSLSCCLILFSGHYRHAAEKGNYERQLWEAISRRVSRVR